MRVRGTCSVLGCPNKGVHKLPANETVRLQWIKVMRLDRQRKVGWNLRRYSRVCSDHFQESDFVYLDFSKWGKCCIENFSDTRQKFQLLS